MYRTQKARGIAALLTAASTLGPDISTTTYLRIVQNTEQLDGAIQAMTWPKFARPCPVTPRHGFVESRAVQSPDELRAVWKETLDADPQGELVIMPVIAASASAVITESSISVGPGNEGATAGHDSVLFPVTHIHNLDCKPIRDVVSGSVFAEVVSTKATATGEFNHYLVQLRDGPKQSGHIGDWIPADITVSNVLPAEGDLLEFEKATKQAPPGTVVYSPGGNLLSHYSIHAQLNNLPIIFSRVPKLGETLSKTVTAVQPDYDIVTIKQGIAAGFHSPNTIDEVQQGLKTCLVALHQGAQTWRTGRPAFLLGYGIGALLLAGTLASMGEGRYFTRRINPGCGSRNDTYTTLLQNRAAARRLLPDMVKMFSQSWRWGDQMGGSAWACCTKRLIELDTIAQTLNTQGCVIEMIGTINAIINLAHNTGRYLNKFLQGQDFDLAMQGRLAPILTALMTDGLHAKPVKREYPAGILPTKLRASHGKIAENRTVAYVSEASGLFGLGTDNGYPRLVVKIPAAAFLWLEACRGDVPKMLTHLKPQLKKWEFRWLRDFHENLGLYEFYGYTQGNWSVHL